MELHTYRRILFKDVIKKIGVVITATVMMLFISTDGFADAGITGDALAGSIYGTVVDAQTGEPLPGANVILEGTNQGTSVDANGNYELTGVEPGTHTLVVRFVGFQEFRQEVEVSDEQSTEVNIELQEESVGLDEVVVTATGEMRSKEVGTSLSRIDANEFEAGSVSNTEDILNGRVTGATILSNSGNPGTGGTIRLRGNNSISQNNNPIIYVDGVRISSGSTPTHQASRQSSSPLNDINPSDIENIDIVKGAAATTLYGTEASGGVIRITTKQGRSGETQWNAGITGGFNNIGHFGPKEDNPTGLFMGRCRGDGLETYDGTTFEDANCPDNDSWLQNGLVQRYNLDVSSGVDNFTYYLSGEYENEEGVINNGGGTRGLGFRGNFQFNPIDEVSITYNSSYNNDNTDWVPSGNNGDGFVLNVTRGPGGNFSGASGCDDPNAICVDNGEILESVNISNREHFVNSLVIETNTFENLSNRLTFGYDYNTSELESTQNFGYSRTPLGQQSITDWKETVLSFEYLGTLDQAINEDINLTLNWGGQLYREKSQTTDLFAEDFSGPQEPTLTSGARTNISGDSRITVTTGGFFGQAAFDLYDKLFVETGVRVDGHSAFGDNYGLEVYPKVSTSYVLSDYDFWPTSWWNTMRLRAAVGQAGQAPGAFDAVRTWRPIAGEDGQPGFTPNQIGNPDLGPERSTEFETGFTASFLDGRVSTDFTYYDQTTTDALIPIPSVPSEGFLASQVQNVGEVKNSGIEADLDLTVLQLSDVQWDMKFGFSKENSEAVNLGNTDEITVAYFARTYIKEGYPVPGVFGAKITNPDEVADPEYEEDHYFGPSYPDKSISLGTTIRLKDGLVLDALGEFKYGGYMLNGTAYQNVRRGVWPSCYDSQQQDPSSLTASERARCALNSGDVSPRYDHWIESTDFFKLRHISLTYNFPEKLLVGGVQSAKLKLAARNLLTITDYSGTDPEIDDYRNSLARRDYYAMPTYRSFLATFNFSF
ncbi:MAG: SusC/RagA family TonB-linked outer membrane protein [Bacteroidota bacterium]